MSALSEPCPSYEPHFWKMGKCKNCFFSRGEHKRYRKELQADDDASSAGEASPPEADGDSMRMQLKRREAKEEMKQLRKERKALASKHSELRDTMMTMEAQMLDYKETKQENDILTKDMKLLRKDLHEITAGAARACEQNELLRQEAAMLRLCLADNGVDAPPTLLDARFQVQPETYSAMSSATASVSNSPRGMAEKKESQGREYKKEQPERNVPSLRLAKPPNGATSQQQTLATAPIVHEIDSSLYALRQNCSTIIQQSDEAQAAISLNFILSMVKALELQSAVGVDGKRASPALANEAPSNKPFSKLKTGPVESKVEASVKNTTTQTVSDAPAAVTAAEKDGEKEERDVGSGREETDDNEQEEGTAGESTTSEEKGKPKKTAKKATKPKSKRQPSSAAPSKRSGNKSKRSIGGKLVAGLKKRASLSVPKLNACISDDAQMASFASYLNAQGLDEEKRLLDFLLALEALPSGDARNDAFRTLCSQHTNEESPLPDDARKSLLDAQVSLDEQGSLPQQAGEQASAAARARLESSFRAFSLRSAT